MKTPELKLKKKKKKKKNIDTPDPRVKTKNKKIETPAKSDKLKRFRIQLRLQDATSPKPKREKLGDDSRNPSVKRHIADLELLPSPKPFKRHRSFDVSRANVSGFTLYAVACTYL